MSRTALFLGVLVFLAGPLAAQEAPHRHGYIPRPEDLTLPPRQVIPPPSVLPGDVPTVPLKVQEAVAIALIHQPSIRIAQANLRAASGRTRQAASGLNPGLSLSATETPVSSGLFNSAGSSASSGGFNSASLIASTGLQASASVRQLLFDFEKTRQAVRQAQSQEAAAGQNLAQADNDVVLQVEQAFYTSLQTERLIHVNETDVQNQREHLQQAEALYRSGVGKPADVVRAENAVASALINLKQAQGDADNARVALAHVMGIDPRTPLQVATGDLSIPADLPLEALIDQALQSRPEVRAAQAVVDADQHALLSAAHTNAPSVTANASVETLPNPIEASQQLELLTASVSVQWAFGDGGLTAGKVQEAAANLDVARNQVALARSDVITDVTQSYINLKTADEKLRLSNVAVSTAEENLKLARGRYSAGLGLSIDVLDAESALLTSLTSQVNQQAAVDQARAALWHALGRRPTEN